jgi:hypothetical protein
VGEASQSQDKKPTKATQKTNFKIAMDEHLDDEV